MSEISATSYPTFLNPQNWILLEKSKEDLKRYTERIIKKNKSQKADQENKIEPSILLIEKSLSPADVYCYLKSKFGEPNGFMNKLRKPNFDNLVDWDYTLVCDGVFITLWGKKRSVQIIIYNEMTDDNWRQLIENFKKCFSVEHTEKSKTKKSLEEWTVFINRYAEICTETSTLYERIDELKDFKFVFHRIPNDKSDHKEWDESIKSSINTADRLRESCISLKVLTPIMLEAFINTLMLLTYKEEIRKNNTLYKARNEEPLHIKVQSLHLNCQHFLKGISDTDEEYRDFKRIMDNRNIFFHGNTNVERDKLEIVYFDKDVPIYKEAGNLHEKFFNKMFEVMRPVDVLNDYIKANLFIIHVINCLDKTHRESLETALASRTLGYNKKEDRYGVLFPDILSSSHLPDVIYDTDL